MSCKPLHYEFRRVTCRGYDHAELSLIIQPLVTGASTVCFEANPTGTPTLEDARYKECIKKGVEEALKTAKHAEQRFMVRVVGANDLSGQSAPVAFQLCARRAMAAYLNDEPGNNDQGSK